MFKLSRRAFAVLVAGAALAPGAAFAADAPKQIVIDWATYNPVSIILKEKGLLEKEFEKDGIKIVWVQSAGSRPGRLFEEIKVDLARPRDRASIAFEVVKHQVLASLDRSLNRKVRPADDLLTAGEGI